MDIIEHRAANGKTIRLTNKEYRILERHWKTQYGYERSKRRLFLMGYEARMREELVAPDNTAEDIQVHVAEWVREHGASVFQPLLPDSPVWIDLLERIGRMAFQKRTHELDPL